MKSLVFRSWAAALLLSTCFSDYHHYDWHSVAAIIIGIYQHYHHYHHDRQRNKINIIWIRLGPHRCLAWVQIKSKLSLSQCRHHPHHCGALLLRLIIVTIIIVTVIKTSLNCSSSSSPPSPSWSWSLWRSWSPSSSTIPLNSQQLSHLSSEDG